MIFDEEFLEYLKNNPLEGTIRLVRIVRENLREDEREWHESDYLTFLEAYALVVEIVESQLLPIPSPSFVIRGNMNDDCMHINQYLNALEEYCTSEASKLKVGSLRTHFKAFLGSGFSYEFSQGDLERVQVLVNQVRDLISQSHGLEKDHQRRLLARLEKLQA